jgi:1,4-dihydroxy-2-naphthoate octaprenyltransferase
VTDQHSISVRIEPDLLRLLTRTPKLNSAQWHAMGWFTRWLVMSRAVVLIMTVASVLAGVLLAAETHQLDMLRCLLLLIGLTFAHATNNLINDWLDHRQGIDKNNYFRRRYGAHVLEDNLVSIREFGWVTGVTALIAITCAVVIVYLTGQVTLYLTLAGAFFVLFYTWPLKHYALGELAVLLVWGPLIVGGSYFVLTQSMSVEVLLVSLIAGIGPTLVIFGKHIDKHGDDCEKGVCSLPVLIGQSNSRMMTLILLIAQWLLIAGLVLLLDAWWLLLCLVSLPGAFQLVQNLLGAVPESRPESYPEDVWPLWHSASAFSYNRTFSLALIAGLVVNLVW